MQDEPETERLALTIDDIVAEISQWDAAYKAKAFALKSAVEEFHALALRNLIKTLANDSSAGQALRLALADPLVYAMLRRHSIIKPSLEEQALTALDIVRPELQQHGGDVELISIKPPGEITIQLTGACDGCGSSQITLEKGVKRTLREHCAWVSEIIVAGNSVSAADVQPIQIISPFEKGSSA